MSQWPVKQATTPLRYSVATLAVLLGLGLRLMLQRVLGPEVPYVTFFPAVVFSAWYGGLWPGIFSAFLSLIVFGGFERLWLGSHREPLPGDAIGAIVFLIVSAFMSALAENARQSHGRIESNLHDLQLAMASRNDAEKALAENRDLLRTTLTSIGDSVITTDAESRITFLNPSAERLTGWTLTEAQGRSISEVFVVLNEHTRLPVKNPTQNALDRGAVVGLANHTILVRKDGREVPIDDSAAPIRDGQQRLFGAVLVFRDISQRRQSEIALKNSEESLKLAVTAGRIGVWDWNLVDKKVSWSDRLYEIHGLEKGSFPGGIDRFIQLVHPDDRAAVHTSMEETMRGLPPVDFQFRIIRPNGEMRWISTTALVFRNEKAEITRVLGATTDISKLKHAEEELRVINRDLTSANRNLEEFACVASHDLQEPLRMVNIYTQLLLRRLGNQDREINQYAGILSDSVARMQALLRDLLAYLRASNADTAEGTADLSISLQEALKILENDIQESGALIKASPLPMTKGETMQMCHVFQNLLSNAIKYRRPGFRPEIQICAQREKGEWKIAVQDNGIGFEPQYAAQIFGLFKRLNNRDYPGTGLGLAICQRIVERFDGRIWAESAPGRGSTFLFTLPAISSSDTETKSLD